MSEEGKELYNTTDFYTTAVLLLKKYPVVKITKEGPGNAIKRFHFEDTEELRQTVLAYMNRKLEGNLRDHKDAIETVKDLIHSG
jgi:hypothetical protein